MAKEKGGKNIQQIKVYHIIPRQKYLANLPSYENTGVRLARHDSLKLSTYGGKPVTIKHELIGDYEPIIDKVGNRYTELNVNGVPLMVLNGSKELYELICLKIIEKGLKPNKKTINQIIEDLETESILSAKTMEVHKRYALVNGALYINTGIDDYRIKISKEGIKRVKSKSVKFVFSKHRGKLAYNREIKRSFKRFIKLLRKYVPVKNEEDLLLLLAYILDSCFSDTDYQILVITGGSGSGKTFLTFIIRCLIDPSTFGIGSLLRSEKDILLQASHNHLLTFDNNGNHFKGDVENLLCQTCTGGNVIERLFFTNNQTLIVDLKSPSIINGLQSPLTQDDAMNRAINIRLPQLTPEDYAKTGGKNNWQAQFEADLPEMIGGLHDLLQRVLALRDEVELPAELPRMGDFVRTGIALEQVLGLEEGSFLKAYENNLKLGLAAIIEDSDLAQAVISQARKLRDTKTYLLTNFIKELKGYSNSPHSIPGNSRTFRTELDRVKKALFELHGIKIKYLKKSRDGVRVMIIPPSKKSS